jgi:repressor LexA
MSVAITDRQKEVITFIHKYFTDKGYPPSFRDISDALGGISTNAVAQHIHSCEKKGYITRNARIPRTLKPTEQGLKLIQL